jgi:DNA-binding response OmpR family regulator
MKILIADDDEALLNMIAFKLKKDKFGEIFTATDGKAAKQIVEEEIPDVIVTDILMPYCSGLELISYVRNELHRNTPIITLSVVGLEDTVLEAFELGANDFMSKPFNLPELLIRIRRAMAMMRDNVGHTHAA